MSKMEAHDMTSCIPNLQSKRKRTSIDLSKCIICQSVSNEPLRLATDTAKESLWNAACIRKDDVFENIENAFGSGFSTSQADCFITESALARIEVQLICLSKEWK